MRNRSLVLGVMATVITGATLATGATSEWSRFRGENGSGVSTAANTPATFTEKDLNWKVPLPGIGHSSPAIAGKKVFVTCGDPDTAKRYLICLDLDSGKTLWKKEYSSRSFKQNPDNSYASASPVVDGQRVYCTFIAPESYKVYCVDINGNDQWTYDMGRWESQHGCGCSPILFEDLLIVPNDQDGPTASVVALDTKTGSVRWNVPRKPGLTSASTPCLYTPSGGGPAQLIQTSTASGITSIDPKTGKLNWAVCDELKLGKLRAVGSPVASGSVVVGTWGEGARNRACAVVEPGADGTTPKVLFRMPTGPSYPYVPSPVIAGPHLFLWSDVGVVSCIDLASGHPIWQQQVKLDRGRVEFYSSPIIVGKKLYNVSKDGEVICLAAGEKFEFLGHSPLGDKCFATPAVVGDRLIIRTASHLMSVGK